MATLFGAPLTRVDGRLKVTGAARYAAEMPMEHMSYAVLAQSTIGKGRIAEIDTAAAEQAPGVVAVMTHRNAPRMTGKSAMQPGEIYPLLQDGVIHYNGQHIALVVAESLEQATYAASLVRVRYDTETPTAHLDDARDKAKPPENFRGGSRPPDSKRGDPDAALAAAPVTLDLTYTTPVEHHNPMEPHAVIASWDADGTLFLSHSTQAVSGSHKRVAELLGVAEDKVHVLNPFVGGGFGAKGSTWPHVTLAAAVARVVKRPVKLVLTRRQMYSATGFRSQTIQHYRIGAEKDGKLRGIAYDALIQTAAFGEFDEPCGLPTEMMYACPNLSVRHRVAPINSGIPTFMRAPGEASGMFALESAMDELACKVGIDPIEARLRNYAEKNEHEDLPWSSKSLRQCYEKGAAAFGWSRRTAAPGSMREGGQLIGWGMASAVYPANRSAAGATVRVMQDGTAEVESGTQDIGTGTYTTMTIVAADELGLPADRVRAKLGDSRMPDAPVSGGSQTSASVLPAVSEAARTVRDQLVTLALKTDPFRGVNSHEIDMADGRLVHHSDPARSASIEEVLQASGLEQIEATSQAKPGDEKKRHSMYAFGAHFVELRIDPDLGEMRVARYVGAFAGGHVIDAKTARSQMLGGVTMGLGMALFEKTEVDRRTGRIVNANVAEYLMPVNADIPGLEILLLDEEDPYVNPLGIKGLGELPIVGVAAAVANAVYHATGKRVRDLPIRIEDVMA